MPFRRLSIQPPTRTMSVCGFPRAPCPMSFKPQTLLPTTTASSSSPPHLSAFFADRPEMRAGAVAVQRRSVPDINTTPGQFAPIKRNSYQGDHRMVSFSYLHMNLNFSKMFFYFKNWSDSDHIKVKFYLLK